MSQNISNFNDECKAFLNGYADFTKLKTRLNDINGLISIRPTNLFILIVPKIFSNSGITSISVIDSDAIETQIFQFDNEIDKQINFMRFVLKLDTGDQIVLQNDFLSSAVSYNPQDFVAP